MKLEKLSDNELVLLAENGSYEKVCSVIYKRYKNKVNSFLYYFIYNKEDREDAIQETMAKVFSNLKKYEIKKAKFNTWLFKIAKNTAIDYLREKNSKKWSVVDYSKDAKEKIKFLKHGVYLNPLEQILKKEFYDFYDEKINNLPNRFKKVIKSRIEGSSYKEISNKFNLPLNTIKVNIHKGRIILEKLNKQHL